MTIFTLFHIFVCLFLVAIVLLQQGKGADMGATFGGGSNTLFGAGGADSLLSRVTTIAAVLFMLSSLALTRIGRGDFFGEGDAFKNFKDPAPAVTPATPDASNPTAASQIPTGPTPANTGTDNTVGGEIVVPVPAEPAAQPAPAAAAPAAAPVPEPATTPAAPATP